MRKIVVYMTELLYGYLILAPVYCVLYNLIDPENICTAVFQTLILAAGLLVCSLGVRMLSGFFGYLLTNAGVTAMICLLHYCGVYSYRDMWILLIFFGITAVSYFLARAKKSTCWLEHPIRIILLYDFVVFLYGSYSRCSVIMNLAAAAAGANFLLVNIRSNLLETEVFIEQYSAMERLPVSRMRKNNTRMIWMQTGITMAAMAAAVLLRIDVIILTAGRILKAVVAFILGFLKNGEPGEQISLAESQEAMNFGLPEEASETHWIWMLLEKLLTAVFWSVTAVLLFLLVRSIVKYLLQLYHQFNERVEENGDIVENLADGKTMERVVKAGKERGGNLFFRRSANDRIRRIYRKRIQKELGNEIHTSWTPEMLEEKLSLIKEDRIVFHQIYEKARYCDQICSKAEAEQMQKVSTKQKI